MSFNEHLSPQEKIELLTSVTQKNYDVASGYYTQRREIFTRFLNKQFQIGEDKVLESLKDALKQEVDLQWTKGVRKLAQDVMFGTKAGTFNLSNVNDRFDKIPADLTQYFNGALEKAIKGQDYRHFWTALGAPYETILEQKIFPAVFQRMAQNANGQLENLLEVFHTGSKTSTASIVSGSRAIRPDIIIGCSHIAFQKDNNGTLVRTASRSKDIPVELQGQLLFELPNKNESNLNNDDVLNDFLKQNNQQFFGFSVKSWSRTNNKVFGSSSQLQKMLNQQFHQTDSEGKRHGWEQRYTMVYITYVLSRNLIHIISPTNVAFITGKGLLWMDDFLRNHIFFMKAQLENVKENTSKKQLYFPNIANSEIYIREYATGLNYTKIIGRSHVNKKQKRILSISLAFT